jgi:hypothetical protein
LLLGAIAGQIARMQTTVPANVVQVDWTMPILGVGCALFLLLVGIAVVTVVASRRNARRSE